jgi:putative endonuclease
MVAAIAREKAIKEWKRSWKIHLIQETNPEWNDLYDELL